MPIEILPVPSQIKNNILSRRSGKLVAIGFSGWTPRKRSLWVFRCDCGKEFVLIGQSFISGNTKSCGCGKRGINKTHGQCKTGAYRSWTGIIQRCTNPKNPNYHYYGGRGITVCDRWRTFENFLADMGERPKGTSIDRADNDKGYEPQNCRWVHNIQQANNKRNNRLLTIDGVTMSVPDWSRRTGVRADVMHKRLIRGWSDKDAATLPRCHRWNRRKQHVNSNP